MRQAISQGAQGDGHFWITLTLGLYLVVESFFDFVPTVPRWLKICVHAVFVLCFIGFLWAYEDHARHSVTS